MRRGSIWMATWLVLQTAPAAWAHPGHGTVAPTSVAHYVAEPLHALPVWATGALLMALFAVAAPLISRCAARLRSHR